MPCFFALQVIIRKLQVKKHDLMKLGDGAMEPLINVKPDLGGCETLRTEIETFGPVEAGCDGWSRLLKDGCQLGAVAAALPLGLGCCCGPTYR